MIILFFAAWTMDLLSLFIFNYSTVLIVLMPIPINFALAAFLIVFSLYLLTKSHEAVFDKRSTQPRLIDSGVYSLVRHPMYLGVLLFCLGFFFISLSLLSLAVWIMFFIFYDKMATFEERDLIRIFGERYAAYQKRVPKWVPRIFRNKA